MTRRFDLVVFDLDGTLVDHHEPIWKTLHTGLGSDVERRLETLRRGLAGQISYPAWVAEDVAMLRAAGATRQRITELLAPLRPTPGAVALLDSLHDAGATRAVLSGGIGMVIDITGLWGHLDHVHINRLRFDAEGALAGAEPTPYDLHHKGEGIRALTRQVGTELRRVAFVGNGRNDVRAAEAAGFSIAWGDAPPELRAVSDVYEKGPDMLEALGHYLL